jgi:protein TonB
MFEDSTFESNCRIHTRSRAWMIATCAFNGSILLAMVLVPLIYPSALPHMLRSFLMAAPLPQPPEPKPVTKVAIVSSVPSQILGGHIFAPTVIPRDPYIPAGPEVADNMNIATADLGDGPNGTDVFGSQTHRAEVHQAVTGPVRVAGKVQEALLIHKTIPVYPPIALAARVQGTVILQATISRAGTIENLRVISGPIMLQNAAMDAVQQWQYKPYLLSGDPVEVETTVNVIFKLN